MSCGRKRSESGKQEQRKRVEEEGLSEVIPVRSKHPSQNWAQDQSMQERKTKDDPWESRKVTLESCINNKLTK